MKPVGVFLAMALLLPSDAAFAADDDIDELYKTKNCFACHRIDRHHNGPTFKSIAIKYADEKGVDIKLVKKIREGSVGVWGSTPMPAQTQVTDAEALTLARWILERK